MWSSSSLRFLAAVVAVVARDRHFDVARDHGALQRRPCAYTSSDDASIGVGAPCACDTSTGSRAGYATGRVPRAAAHVLRGSSATVDDVATSPQEHRRGRRPRRRRRRRHRSAAARNSPGLEQELAVAGRRSRRGARRSDSPARAATAGSAGDRGRARRARAGSSVDATLAALAADQRDLRDLAAVSLDRLIAARPRAAQLEVARSACSRASAPGSARRRSSAA